jgi:hypothetical protein
VPSEWILGTTCYYIANPILEFSSFERLVGGEVEDTFVVDGVQDVTLIGGAGDDVFVLNSGALVLGAINGQGGIDTLQYEMDELPPFDLDAGTATNVEGGISEIEIVMLKPPPPPPTPKPEPILYRYIVPPSPEALPVIILVSGGELVPLKQGVYNLLVLDMVLGAGGVRLTGGDYVRVFGDLADYARLTPHTEDSLPAELPADCSFVSAMTIELFRGQRLIASPLPWRSILLSFVIPQELLDREFAILYWDEVLNTWVEIPLQVIDLTSDGIAWVAVTAMVRIWDPTLNAGQGGWVEKPAAMLASDEQLTGGFKAWLDVPSAWADLLPDFAPVSARANAYVNQTGTYVLVTR